MSFYNDELPPVICSLKIGKTHFGFFDNPEDLLDAIDELMSGLSDKSKDRRYTMFYDRRQLKGVKIRLDFNLVNKKEYLTASYTEKDISSRQSVTNLFDDVIESFMKDFESDNDDELEEEKEDDGVVKEYVTTTNDEELVEYD